MRYLGLDFGSKTIGISISDKTNIIASSLEVIRYENDYFKTFERIKELTDNNKIKKIVLGLPKNMNNTLGERAEKTLKFKQDLETFLKIEIVTEDERLTTKEATKTLIEADMSRKKRKKVIDKVAATFILQKYLDKLKKEGE